MAVITETAPAQTLVNGLTKLKLNGHAETNGHSNGYHTNGSSVEAKEQESKLVDPFNYVVSLDRAGHVTSYRAKADLAGRGAGRCRPGLPLQGVPT